MKRNLILLITAVLVIPLIKNPCLAQNNTKVQNIDSGAIWIDRFTSDKGSWIGGKWFSFSDGASYILPRNIKECYVGDADRKNEKVFQFSYSLYKSSYQWGPFVAVGVTLTKYMIDVPFSKIKGIAYDYKGSEHNFVYLLSTITDYGNYQKTIPASSEWKTIVIPFDQLHQPEWGIRVKFEADKVSNLHWQIMGKDGQKGELAIDNIRFITQLPSSNEQSEISLPDPNQAYYRHIPSIVKIAEWKGFKKAAYSLTFDDNLSSQLTNVLPILDQYNLKGTFYVMTNSGSWQQFTSIQSKGHEIGSHSTKHSNLTELSDGNENAEGSLQYELTSPVKTINTQLPSYKVITFAYPFGLHNPHVIQETRKRYYASRGVWQGFNSSHPDWMNLRTNALSYSSNRTLNIDLKKMDSLEIKITQELIKIGGWGIFLAHDVLPFSDAINATNSWHPVSKESFESFVKWLKAQQDRNELWIETVGNVTRYAKERDAVDIQVISQGNTQMQLLLEDNLPNDIFNYPLTLEVSVPWSWKKVKVIQGNSIEALEVKDGKIIMNVIPDTGVIDITKTE